MAINITDADALDKLAAIEGEDWRKHQGDLDGYTVASFRRKYEDLLRGDSKEREMLDRFSDLPINVDGNTAIYGRGGYNRYFVRSNGEIIFSEMHARSDDDLSMANELGFTIR